MKGSLLQGLLLLLYSPLSVLSLSTPTTIFTLPGPVAPASWFENLAVRPNGLILATRGDAPEIWQIDPATGQGALLVSVTGAYNLTGIAEVLPPPHQRPQRRRQQNCAETYVFGSSHIPAPLQVEPGSAKVWTLQFPSGGCTTAAPTVALLAAMPNAGFINGVAAWRPGRVLLSDTEAEAVYVMDVATGAYTTPLTGLTGVNGIKVAGGYVYRADHASQTLSRIPVDADTAVATGPAEVLADNQSIDDFAIAVDGTTGQGKAYITAMYDNKVVEVAFGSAPSSGVGVKTLVADNLSGTGSGLCTVVAFGRRTQDSGLLYATVGQGGGSAAIVSLDPSQ
ncbi:hypothetical protein C8A00DRAFT_30469 [Chaetomidium leptoderma]|uniref:Uncharacterized protein n=1 Tax=Chaetomidium leptoderma TaxID=669021 RepID=A0AAN6VUT4_9PEZI|nr:hypothetical protein C8A00DRAFT_30469 [Chaetomidium leptoderma]